MMTNDAFSDTFNDLTGRRPFPWQEKLYAHLLQAKPDGSHIPNVTNLPTGMGKTSILAVWLIALAHGAQVPRRLVYVVNRRTVVDQTTVEAERLKKAVETGKLPGVSGLAVSTLRGQYADNHKWSDDPSLPAIICGTVDMIGSRLLFSGYRIGFKSRPLHAGFLGQDALLVHDESHLEPAFQRLVESIKKEQHHLEQSEKLPWPKLHVMALSATTKHGDDDAIEDQELFGLTVEEKNPPQDIPDPPIEPVHHLWRRLKAVKKLQLHGYEEKMLVDKVVSRALSHKEFGRAILVFMHGVKGAADVADGLRKALEKDTGKSKKPPSVITLTGTMRGLERDELVRNNVFVRFLQESDRSQDVTPAQGTVYLVCTSAGEVGVNLTADDMVCDLSTFDSMAQRLGRVNRFGDRRDTQVDVFHPDPETFDETKPNPQRKATLELLHRLHGDASPKALMTLMESLSSDQQQAAFAPEPIILPATDILFDAWALTSVNQPLPGRPPVAPYLHGVADWEPARTSVAWREEVEVIDENLLQREGEQFPKKLLDDYPLKPHELLNDTTERVYDALSGLAKHAECDWPVWIIGDSAEVTIKPLSKLLEGIKKQVIERLADCTILLPPSLGGLTAQGMLDGKPPNPNGPSATLDVADQWFDDDQQGCVRRIGENDHQRRVRHMGKHIPPDRMTLIRKIDIRMENEDSELSDREIEQENDSPSIHESTETSGETGVWYWYTRPNDAPDATLASLSPVTWKDHTDAVVLRTTRMVKRLNLPEELQQAVILAAELHDLGKQRESWQRSIGNPNPNSLPWYAKSGKPEDGKRWKGQYINGYRHEFGSLLDILDTKLPHLACLNELSEPMRDLALHLIATHHGYARPHFTQDGTIDQNHPKSKADEIAVDVMRRFARLQRLYGRWGLAYLESLLRAADWAASANSTSSHSNGKAKG